MFTKILNVLKGLFSGFAQIIPLLSAFGVKVPPEAIKAANAAPLVTGIMQNMEDLLGDGTGAVKKAAVVAMATAGVQVLQSMSTGGQKTTWDGVDVAGIPALVEVIATAANGVIKTTVVEDVTVDNRSATGGL